MFTGIIQTLGRIESLVQQGDAVRLTIVAPDLDTSDVALGDSIAVSGPCLTAVALGPDRFEADVSPEPSPAPASAANARAIRSILKRPCGCRTDSAGIW